MSVDYEGKKSLLVEDDPALRKLMLGHLSRMGFQVTGVGDGRTALAWLSSNCPDLVCLDLMLPETSGYDLCEFIRSSPPLKSTAILVVSARTLPEDRAQAEELGANAYLVKPFTHAEFSSHVRKVMQRRRSLVGAK